MRHSGRRAVRRSGISRLPSAFTRDLEIPGSMRSLSSGRALRGPVGIAPECRGEELPARVLALHRLPADVAAAEALRPLDAVDRLWIVFVASAFADELRRDKSPLAVKVIKTRLRDLAAPFARVLRGNVPPSIAGGRREDRVRAAPAVSRAK
jgi:hypothetical protein